MISKLFWLSKAAAGNHPEAQFQLGCIYHEEANACILHSTTKHQEYLKKVLEWITKSASQNFPQAQYNLGILYYQGLVGLVDRDERKAMESYTSQIERAESTIKEANEWFAKVTTQGLHVTEAEKTKCPIPFPCSLEPMVITNDDAISASAGEKESTRDGHAPKLN